jgi:hypothetical protein
MLLVSRADRAVHARGLRLMDSARLWLPGMIGRVNAALAQDVDFLGYEVSATKLRQVIRDGPGSNELKRRLIGYLNRRVIKGRPTVKCVLLGVAMSRFAETTDDEDLIAISYDINDLNKLPYVIANGQPVS